MNESKLAMEEALLEWYLNYEREAFGATSLKTEVHLVKNKIVVHSSILPSSEIVEDPDLAQQIRLKLLEGITRCSVINVFTCDKEEASERVELFTLDCNLEQILYTPYQIGD